MVLVYKINESELQVLHIIPFSCAYASTDGLCPIMNINFVQDIPTHSIFCLSPFIQTRLAEIQEQLKRVSEEKEKVIVPTMTTLYSIGYIEVL